MQHVILRAKLATTRGNLGTKVESVPMNYIYFLSVSTVSYWKAGQIIRALEVFTMNNRYFNKLIK